ncbi:MFS transporter [Microbacterium sp. VKM Ac-2870]|uniref:MFS transporter n=1 Tax=Microbacterium sp. VKM Ac-2870 TaxID=2783825 RepID=UPI00188A1BD0|nr:MFS transporter [Microbacterium sp. VKM Ac-2870]MBF4562538.1 MFS transporter [Microbacterium sp. VKM Ac-2870]
MSGDATASSVASAPPTAWTSLRIKVFRAIWLAGIVSNIGSWMQSVGAQWMLVEGGSGPAVVALVQTAAAAPVLLLAIPAGVLGEFMNRRRMLIAVQTAQVIVVGILIWLTAANLVTPPLLLVLTLLLGAGSAIQLPAYQALVTDIVPAPLVQGAAALTSIGVNVARAVGPALAGLLVAQAGVVAVFAANAISFAAFVGVLLAWRGYSVPRGRPERFIDATRAGLRYVRHSRVILDLFVRLALFLLPANALWALLPIIASAELHLQASGYGLLLTALGIGSIAGGILLPTARKRWTTNTTLVSAAGLYGASTAALVVFPSIWTALPLLVLAGIGWIGVIATVNGTVQAFLPAWVRTRGLSVYQLVLFGGTAIGAALAGAAAGFAGVAWVTGLCGALIVVLAAAGVVWPTASTVGRGRGAVELPFPEGSSVDTEVVDAARRPVLVLLRYRVAAARQADFLAHMEMVGHSRRRTGARSWRLYENHEQPGTFVEAFAVGSWQEHLSQHADRDTQYDDQLLADARQFSEDDPAVEHLIAVPERHAKTAPTRGG